ncbi:MAG: type II methionyl aminopeptidase [Candidatus Bathyarchaeia archaeon]
MVDEDILECYVKAGRIVAGILSDAHRIVKVGRRLLDICVEVENTIRSRGGKPAFPCNICVDYIAAHYTSPPGDYSRVPDGSLVKLDVGVHIGGYIADGAITVCFDDRYENLKEAVYEALDKAIKLMKPNVKVSEIGAVIQRTIRDRGFKPIENLTGHEISRFNLHAGLSIPNIDAGTGKLRDGSVYAVEPFATIWNAMGSVVSSRDVYIFRCQPYRTLKDEEAWRLLTLLYSNFSSLPFAERWILDIGIEELDVSSIWRRLRDDRKAIFRYPVLIEAGRGVVAQSEHTVFILNGEPYVLTKF